MLATFFTLMSATLYTFMLATMSTMSHGNVILDILDPGYCIFVYVCICVCVFVIVFVISERQWVAGVRIFQKIYDLIGLT